MTVLLIALGLVCLVVGGEGLVRGSVAVARGLGVSPLLIGLTLVGFGTSTPELMTSLAAAFANSPGLAIGNVVGSNIANILLILGVTAVIVPVATVRAALWRDGTALGIATTACLAVVLAGTAGRVAGALLVTLLGLYLLYTIRRERRVPDAAAELHGAEATMAEPGPRSPWLAVAMTVGGLCLTMLGAHLLVRGAIDLAAAAGLSETLIGLTIVAVGTSLPELTASVVAACRRQTDLAFGNIIGSNLFNILGILGITALVRPIPVPPEIVTLDIWVMLGATAAMLVFATTGARLVRLEGAALVAAYGGYIAWLAAGAI
ncbi:calcium/sodium antiporter [Marivibrio halodurans]|uniref:Calcium/sodium antiporter n=1 Tax=Marivibrio halodurans TaxID=2039722 RepID=A0A8J7S1Q7_9PROT|nr:calcium/sodium antiporter [Marivibrio halodurans]MBP5858265.1 calcium/sodium antiporter [Marivibrio halodurans]